MKPLRYVYINLEEDTARKEQFLTEFPGVDWWRFPGCRGGLMWGEIARGMGMLGDIRKDWRGALEAPEWGTLGCSLSHIFCLKMASISGGIVLFPDDATNSLGWNIETLVAEALEHRPPGVGWIKLKNHRPLYQGPAQESGGWTFRKLAPVPADEKAQKLNTGSAAVIILRKQAAAILERLPPLTSNGIDFELRAIVDKVPGGCWEMCGTGIGHRYEEGKFKGSSRRRINNR